MGLFDIFWKRNVHPKMKIAMVYPQIFLYDFFLICVQMNIFGNK